ncbi:MAG: sortase [Oscillospiraceae bacterium]|jgi:sortase B|nr:sortase [Oscillospiraceae bacterium]
MPDETNTPPQAQDGQDPQPTGQIPPQGMPYPYPFYGYGAPQGMPPMPQMPPMDAQGQMPYPGGQYPMFIPVPVPMMMSPYGYPQALPPQGGASLNSYERQAGMQVVYQDGAGQQPMGYGGYMPPMMPMMPPYGYGGMQPPFAGYGATQQPPKAAFDEDVEVLYQAHEQPPTEPEETPQPVQPSPAAKDTKKEDAPKKKSAKEPVGEYSSLRDLFEEAGVTVLQTLEEEAEDLADLFEEPGTHASPLKQQWHDLFPHKEDSKGEKVRKSVFLTLIPVILISASLVLNTFLLTPMREAKKLGQVKTVVMSVPIPMETMIAQNADVNFLPNMQAKYAGAYVENQDLRGWINIPWLEIDYPVVQKTYDDPAQQRREGNQYYLSHAFDGSKNKYGVPFFDTYDRFEPAKLSRNLVIYGHNNKYVDLVFHNLLKYADPAQWQAEPTIKVDTVYAEYRWQIYAVFYAKGERHSEGEYLFPYNWVKMDSDQEFLNYIAEVDRRKLYDTGIKMQPDDHILTLSTCAYNFDNSRFVVVARLVKPGEEPYPDRNKVRVNANPQYPAYYYQKKKLNNPFKDFPDWQYDPKM